MLCATLRPVWYLFLALAALASSPPVFAAADLYDVSYLWHRDLAGVLDYRERVGGILGPGVAKKLKVVADGDLFGLIYFRRGSSAGATKVAKAHTRLLRRKGLEAAAPLRSKDWRFFDDGGAPPPALPGKPTAKPKRTQEIRDLEAAVEDHIKQLRREGKIATDERTGWSVYDFTTGEKLVTINEDIQFQAASLIKPFVAAAFFHQVERGKLHYGPKSRRHMERMIQRSSNTSTNWVMRQVGGPRKLERLLRQQYPGIFQDTHIVEYIPANGRTYRNKASIHDYSRFLYALWAEGIAGAREIKRLMALPGNDRIYTGVNEIPAGTQVYNKTGSTSHLCGDMGILIVKGRDGKRYPYTLIGIIEKRKRARNYSAWIRARGDVIRSVSNIVYKGIAQHHNFADVL